MQPIIPPIAPGETGPPIANLQDALLRLLSVVEPRLIRALPAPNLPTVAELQHLTEGLKQDRALPLPLFGEATTKLIGYYQVQEGLGDNLRGVVEDGTAAKLNELLRSMGLLDVPSGEGFVVSGHVEGAGAGHRVRAYDQDFRSEEFLGESSIDGLGNYEIRYSAEQFKLAEKGRADLRLAVCEPDGRELVSSDVLFHADPKTVVVLTVSPGSRPASPSEYERYVDDLRDVLQGLTLSEVASGGSQQLARDLNFLAGDTGIDRQHIGWLVQAVRLAHETRPFVEAGSRIAVRARLPLTHAFGIPPEAFYGWLRQGVASEWEALRAVRISTLRTALLDALDKNLIPAWVREEIDGILSRLPNPEMTELEDLLDVSALTPDMTRAVFAQLDGIAAVSDEVLSQLVEQKALAEEEAQQLGLTVSLHRLAGGARSVVATMLDSEFASVRTGRLRHARDLASLEPAEWERALERADSPLPSGLSRPAYARSLAMEAANAYPNTAFRQRVVRVPLQLDQQLDRIQTVLAANRDALAHEFDELDLSHVERGEREALREAHGALRELANVHPGLGLHTVFARPDGGAEAAKIAVQRIGWLSTLFELNPEVSFLGLDYLPGSDDLKGLDFGSLPDEARALVLADLKAHQRVHSVATNPIPALEIMRSGFHSASAIALARAPDFTKRTGLPEAEAHVYHGAALELANAAALRWFKLNEVARDKVTAPIRSIPSRDEFFKPLQGFTELLNDQPWCECERCQSVLSPAAYFVDLMYYIEQNVLKDSFTGQEAHPLHLRVRRPDLWNLELTCKNTTEYLPYLDVVNGVLEPYISSRLSLAVGTATLYKHLAEHAGSFQQPFSLPIERLELLLGHFGLSRYAIAKAMGSERTIQARARLKLSQKEYDLITTAGSRSGDLSFLQQLFKLEEEALDGSSADTPLAPLEMRAFLHATGLTHEIVESALTSTFVNTDGSSNARIEVLLGKRAPDDVQNNSELVKNVTVKRLDRIHRFVRLWRKLPWTIDELDYVLTRLAGSAPIAGIDAGGIRTPGTLKKILDLLDLNSVWLLPVDELMALFGVFPERGLREQTSLFDRLFNQPPFLGRDGRWPPATETSFTHPAWARRSPPGVPAALPGLSAPTNNTLTRLLAGLQLADAEFLELAAFLKPVAATGYQPATDTVHESILLSGDSIGIFYRHARLMRLLETSATDFVKLVGLTPIGKRTLPADRYIRDLGDVITVVEFAAWQKDSGFDLDELVYMTGGPAPEGTPIPVTLATELVRRVQKEKSLEFADTLFTELGLTELQSRQIVEENTTTTTADKTFVRLEDGATYRLRGGVDPSATPPNVAAAIDATAVKDLLGKYHLPRVLDVSLAGAFQMSHEQVELIRALARPSLVGTELTAISTALDGDPDTKALSALIADMLRFRALLVNKLFDVPRLSFVLKNKAVFGLPNNQGNPAITVDVVRNVAAYVALASSTDPAFTTASDPADIEALERVLEATGIGSAKDADLAKALRTDQARIGALKPHLLALPSNPFDALDVLARCLVFTEQLGVSGETLGLMIKEEPTSPATFDRLSRAAEDVFGAFRAKYPNEKIFQEKMEPFEDKLRTRKRDGLVDFIVSQWPEPFADANKLYEYFLIDVLVEGCARTSPVVAAISSLQLYVHRVLMNLEKSADLKLDPSTNEVPTGVTARFEEPGKREEWYWRKNYRVWEANRKIFLYPENYIEPELRDDKTPLFNELEDALLQQEVNDSSVYDAYRKYLTGFDEVARLKIAGAYYAERSDVLHLFGVTQDAPPVYYYRAIENSKSGVARLSAWQKLIVQIPVRKVSPIVFLEHLYVFWQETTTKALSKFVGGTSKFQGYRHSVRVKYSTLRLDGRWSPPQGLSFDNGTSAADSLTINDPLVGWEEKDQLAKQIADLKAWRTALQGPNGEGGDKKSATDEVARTLGEKGTAEGDLSKRASTGDELAAGVCALAAVLAVSNPTFQAGAITALGTATAAAAGWALLNGQDSALAGATAGADAAQLWLEAAVVTATAGTRSAKSAVMNVLAMAVGAPVAELEAAGATASDKLYVARRKIVLHRATLAAAAAATRLQEVMAAIQKVNGDIAAVQLVIDRAQITAYWDKSRRDHSEPLDNYRPEGWNWDRIYPSLYTVPGRLEPSSIRLRLAAVDPGTPWPHEIDLTSGVVRQAPLDQTTWESKIERPRNINGSIQRTETSEPVSAGLGFYYASSCLNDPVLGNVVIAQAPATSDMQAVNGVAGSIIVESMGDVIWLRRVPTGVHLGTELGARKLTAAPYLGTRLGTSLTANLVRHFGHGGVGGLLTADGQDSLDERERPAAMTASNGQSELHIPRNPFDRASPYLTYFRETFFHIPFLIANHLNSQQKFAETQRWYHFIFDPTAADDAAWRYREFRDLETKSLRAMLSDDDGLAAYRSDPFNPHAIARTRLGAYQKSIVMKYIDNLLDWGDSLFNQFTMESVNEATMLYVMAQDILGPRPATLGSCGEGKVWRRSYAEIASRRREANDFLIELEAPPPRIELVIRQLAGEAERRVMPSTLKRQQASTSTMSSGSPPASAPSSLAEAGAGPSTIQPAVAGLELKETGGNYWTNVGGTPLKDLHGASSGASNAGSTVLGTDFGAPRLPGHIGGNIDFVNQDRSTGGGKFGVRDGAQIEPFDRVPPLDVKHGRREAYPPGAVVSGKRPPGPIPNPLEFVPSKDLVFCIPPNKDLLAYWGRVEDRLFKIRNCMDIAGVRRRLELFAPEIDPRFLVRMKASGLTLDDVLGSTRGNLPPYRFTYLIEKAKQHAGTVQSFGAQLLSAIEKRDGEELAQLRTVHEQNLLKLRSRMMQLEIAAGEDAIEGLRRQKAAAEYRQDHFRSLSDVGPIASERKQQQHQREASEFRTQASVAQLLAAVLTIIPDVGAFTAMKFGGSQLGAAGKAVADGLNALAAFNEMSASMAGMEASNQRRDQDWKHQAENAKRDISQIEKQITAAEIKRDIALHSLDVHDKTIEQSEEVFAFLGEKFSSFGRYTLLSTRLHGLYRQAFDSALSLAKMTEQAYRAERREDDILLDGKYWDADNAGLLAGERLLIDLQALEAQFIERNYRELEIEQSFSLAQFAPDKLATLRLTGTCNFEIPEWFFDLTYPGHYRRRLKAVRLTIPCVIGPYANVGATLRLDTSAIRLKPLDSPKDVPLRHTVEIAASKGQYDAGVFDFNFRDERYMPFEGAGAISTWEVSLPKSVRVFDYDTISDVIVHLSYTAQLDRGRKELLDGQTQALMALLREDDPPRLMRLFSLRDEFPDVFHRLVTSREDTPVEFAIESRHFPLFLGGRLRAGAVTMRVLSPLTALPGAKLAIGRKAAVGALQTFKDVAAPAPANPAPQGREMRTFDFDAVTQTPAVPGIDGAIVGNYVIKLKKAGPLAPILPGGGAGPIEPSNLHDIILQVAYSLGP